MDRTAAPMSWSTDVGVSLRYVVEGAGPRSLVLIHEMGGSLESFDQVVERLCDAFRILRYDQRGAGLSEKPRAAFSLADHVGDLERLVTQCGLDPPLHLCGVAAGAAIAVAFARRHPRRVAALALCAPALAVDAQRQHYLVERSEMAIREGMSKVADFTLARSYPPALRAADPARFAAYRGRFLANDPVSYAHANLALVGVGIGESIGSLGLPCLMLAGRHDAMRPAEQVAALAARTRGCEFALIDSGHLVPVQAPEELSRRLSAFFRAGGNALSA